jgi:hypothetical protein
MAKVIVPDKYFNAVYNNIYVDCADRDEFHGCLVFRCK